MTVKWIGCATGNYAVGRSGHVPTAIVIHLMDGYLRGTDQWFLTGPEKRAGEMASSAHYGIGQSGEIHQYVKDEDRAYHAGRIHQPSWGGLIVGINPNSYTLGIEHEGFPEDPWSLDMMTSSATLIGHLSNKFSIPIDRRHIIGHHEIYSLKSCPGPNCDLERLVYMAANLISIPTAPVS